MCLCTANIKGEVSNRPIKCYKVYRKTKDGKLESYFKRREYDLKEGDEVIAEGNAPVADYIPIPGATYSLSSGFIHAFRNEGECMDVLKAEMNYMRIFGIESVHMKASFENCEGFCFCEMEIPAGEKYWVGNCNDICAKRMVFKGVTRTVMNNEFNELARGMRRPLEF